MIAEVQVKTRLESWTEDRSSWIKAHSLVNCGNNKKRKNQRKVCPSVSGLWLSAPVGGGSAFMSEWEGESYCVWGNQWAGAAPLTTPHRVHPPLFVQVCLPACREFPSERLQRIREEGTVTKDLQAQQVRPRSSDTRGVIHPSAQSCIPDQIWLQHVDICNTHQQISFQWLSVVLWLPFFLLNFTLVSVANLYQF